MRMSFEWDEAKNQENQSKHGVSFEVAQYAFADIHRVILKDIRHSVPEEERFYCVARLEGSTIRILGAGFWRKYRKLYLANE